MCAEFPDHKILKNISCNHYHQKPGEGGDKCPGHHIIVPNFQVIVIVGIEFINIGLHAQVCERVDHIRNRYECAVQSVFRRGESAFAGK